jgi:hypothetical protein
MSFPPGGGARDAPSGRRPPRPPSGRRPRGRGSAGASRSRPQARPGRGAARRRSAGWSGRAAAGSRVDPVEHVHVVVTTPGGVGRVVGPPAERHRSIGVVVVAGLVVGGSRGGKHLRHGHRRCRRDQPRRTTMGATRRPAGTRRDLGADPATRGARGGVCDRRPGSPAGLLPRRVRSGPTIRDRARSLDLAG